MPLPAAFLDELRGRTAMAALVARRVRLVRSGRQWKGCCPFHNEKTPSFYVYDNGFHCFGCGAHGDAISWVMQSQGVAFPEAIAQLAAEAGLEVPRPSREAAEAERHRVDLDELTAAAAAHYESALRRRDGEAALAYLHGRGLDEAAIARFRLGWAGEGADLVAALAARGGDPALMAESGLIRMTEEGAARAFFFRRVMFPILDPRGRVRSFGGRLLGEGQPKYLNGPETALFAKRRTLYAPPDAAALARRGADVVVVEGYMDVIAVDRAQAGCAVAPLGTALTEEQLVTVWNLAPSPILCFDADAAGRRAMARAAELALPLLTPERTLRIAVLPEGQDPDSLARARPEALAHHLAAARPLGEALFDLLREGGATSPEQRAAFRRRLEAASARIADRALATEYRRALLGRFFDDARRRRTPSRPAPTRPRPDGAPDTERGRILAAILLHHPDLLRDVDEAFATVALPPWLARLRDALHGQRERTEPLDSEALLTHLRHSGLAEEVARTLAAEPYPLPACAAPGTMPAEAETCWWHIFGFLHLDHLSVEVEAATRELGLNLDAKGERRLTALVAALRRIETGEPDGVAHAG